MAKRLFYPVTMFSVVVVALASCGKADVNKASTQIAAKVNGDEISVHQVNSVIARGNGRSKKEAEQHAARQALRLLKRSSS